MATKTYIPLEDSYTKVLSKDGTTPLGFSTSDVVSLFTSTSFLWSAGIMISVVAAGFMYMRAGVIRMQASEAGVRKSNEEIKRVTIGLLGVLSLFVILYTFNKGLLRGDVQLSNLKASSYTSGGGGVYGGAGATVTTPPVDAPQTTGSEQVNRDTLSAAGIGINHAACATPTSRECTNVGNINPATIAMLLKLKSECNCAVFITGGSEPNGHGPTSNHGPNKEAVDIQYNKELGDFLLAKTVMGNTSPCNIRRGYSGFIFWDEPVGCEPNTKVRHFHASFSGR